jgi:hypothetical protein
MHSSTLIYWKARVFDFSCIMCLCIFWNGCSSLVGYYAMLIDIQLRVPAFRRILLSLSPRFNESDVMRSQFEPPIYIGVPHSSTTQTGTRITLKGGEKCLLYKLRLKVLFRLVGTGSRRVCFYASQQNLQFQIYKYIALYAVRHYLWYTENFRAKSSSLSPNMQKIAAMLRAYFQSWLQ